MESIKAFKARLQEVHNLDGAMSLLGWDQQVKMPVGGASHRAAQMGTLSKIRHEMFTAEETGRLLEDAETEGTGLDYDADDAALLRVVRHDYDLATKVPTALVEERTRVRMLAQGAWVKARPENDYESFKPWIKQMFDLTVQMAEHLGYEDCIYDALLDQYEPGMKTAQVAGLFEELKEAQIPMIRALADQKGHSNDLLKLDYAEGAQETFGIEVAKAIGYDFGRGRLDVSPHPFTSNYGRDDVRITTRYRKNWLPSAMFGTMHECGHGMYEQGSADSLAGTYLEGGTSLGLHESQSRLWENLVGRSKNFWRHYFPRVQELFPAALGDVDMETFYQAINHVEPSLIRVEADEVTYNMHIIIRFELENELVEGTLSVDDAPDAWNAKYEEYLGITPPNHTDGILQDIHWSMGLVGYFATYSLGNLLSVPLYNKALEAHPEIPAEVAQGEFGTLYRWLQANVYAPGRKYTPTELFQRVTGETISAQPYLAYLREKYGELYDL
ncbi:carboxypeptidase M32 [Chloroflexota bacterium]